MSVESTDVKLKLSTKSGSAGNTNSGSPGEALGKYISTSDLASGDLHNLFPEISGPENVSQNVDYQCVFVHNANSTNDTFLNVKVYILSEVAGGAEVEIGVDPTAASAIGSSSAQAVQITDKDTAPSGVTFSKPVNLSNGINLGNIPAGQCRAIWVQRSALNTDPASNDGAILRVQGETL